MISEGQRLQYLEAIGIQAWISRDRPLVQVAGEPDFEDQPECGSPVTASTLPGQQQGDQISARPPSFEIGPGSASTLLLCTRPEDAATPLASDIARCLDEAPVWGWLSQDHGETDTAETAISLERAISERLFTRVLLFCGDATAHQVGKVEVLSSAHIIYAPPIAELANHPAHKRRLWMQLLSHGWCTRRG